jgi:hypothetical protein
MCGGNISEVKDVGGLVFQKAQLLTSSGIAVFKKELDSKY